MVMHKVRASTYLRRTLSEPFSRRRLSTLLSQQQAPGDLHADLLAPSSQVIDHADYPQYTWQTDFLGLKQFAYSWFNILLIFCPFGMLSYVLGWPDVYAFWFSFLGLIPLAALLGNLTEEVALHTGDLVGGLLNATFGNAVEMIITVQSLREGLITVVQGTLLGSILSNLLLVLGMSFFAGGLNHYVQKFNAQGATCSTSLLMLASLAFITPTVSAGDSTSPEDVLKISRLTALLMAMTYALFLFFQLYTHFSLFKDEGRDVDSDVKGSSSSSRSCEEIASLSFGTSVITLIAVTLVISYQSQCLVSSIEGVSRSTQMPESFIGVILLPIVGNAAEHATAVTVAIKDKPDLTMGVAVGSSTQVALFMVPFAVLAGWMLGVPMTLAFTNVSATVLAFSILIVIGVVQDGESNWLEGVMLMVAYAIIAVVFWYDKSSSGMVPTVL